MTRRLRGLGLLLVLAVLAAGCQLPFTEAPVRTVQAVLHRSNNLFEGSDVRILGLRVGEVARLEEHGPGVLATMEIDPQYDLPADVHALVIPTALLGERFIQLEPPYVDGPTLPDGEIIPTERTRVPAEVDEVLASFEQFLAGLDPDTVAELVEVLAETLEGQGQGLNTLLDQAATTVRVLADTSGDLNAVVDELADLNTQLATRDRQIGTLIEDWSVVVRTIAQESDEIIAGVDNLRRLTAELRPLTDRHADRLVTDLEILTTTLSTVERNLTRLDTMILGGRQLFEGAGRGIDFPNARLRLDNEAEEVADAIVLRLADRLVGLCLRLGVPECSTIDFWEPLLPAMMCVDGLVACDPTRTELALAIAEALGHLPPEAVEVLVAQAEERQQPPAPAEPAPEAAPAPPPEEQPSLLERLPLPDPRLQEQDTAETSFLDRLARFIGGGG